MERSRRAKAVWVALRLGVVHGVEWLGFVTKAATRKTPVGRHLALEGQLKSVAQGNRPPRVSWVAGTQLQDIGEAKG